MDYKKLEELNNLRKSGALTEEEFEAEKQKLFSEETKESVPTGLPMGITENSYLGLMNLLILIPYMGWIIPIILWVIGKEHSEKVNTQGKYILNWYFTWVIVAFALIVLFFILYAHYSGDTTDSFIYGLSELLYIVVLFALGIASIAFPIIGGIKGLDGKIWRYPISVSIMK